MPTGKDIPDRESWGGGVRYLAFLLLASAGLAIRYAFYQPCLLNLAIYADGTERLPFQSRILTAWILRGLVQAPLLGKLLSHGSASLPGSSQGAYSAALFLLCFASLLIATFAVRAILRLYIADPGFATWASLLVLYMSYFNLVIGWGGYTEPYDLPALAFMTLGVYLVLRRSYLWLALLVFVGSFNRETVIFLPAFLLLYVWFEARSDRPYRGMLPVAAHAALQIVLCLGVRAYLHTLLKNNPVEDAPHGGIFSVRLVENARYLLKPQFWPLLFSTFGYSLVVFKTGFTMILDRALAKATAVVLVFWVMAMLIAGVVIEVRIYNELCAFLAPCVALILWRQWQQRNNPMILNSSTA